MTAQLTTAIDGPPPAPCQFCRRAHRPDEIVWLTTAEVATRYRTAPSSVREWVRRDQGPRGSAIFGKQRLFPACSVDAWQQEQIEKQK